MPLVPGTRLGVFEILGPLGAGGMGEVYRARDTRLGREVAVKVLPEAFARDPARVARFEREARLLASINHPAIAAIYGAEESGEVRYLVMELVPGDTLAAMLSRGPIPLTASLAICRQIADGLEAAHEKGVVHRDLKPSNIKVTPEEKVKILDLGLAKAMEMPAPGELSNSPTVTLEQTRPGTILGTVEFMSPEQARGKEVDKRTDIWAFGCILFEMLSGKRAFTGETISDVFAAILTKEPDWSALPPDTPPQVQELLSRCLQKDPVKRLRDVGDARMEIERRTARVDEKSARAVGFRRRYWSVAAVLALLLAGGLLWLLMRLRSTPPGAAVSDRSLVVLPANVIGDYPGGQLIGDGLVETMSVRLNEVPGIQVVTPAAAVAASDKNSDPFGAARSVGANLVVRSSVVRSGERVRIIYSVWNVRTRAQMAGGTIDGSASDLFGMQDELAENVAAKLKLPKPARKTPTSTGLQGPPEQDTYLQAIGHLQRYDSSQSVDEAIRLLAGLRDRSPVSALVHAALGRAYLHKYFLTHDKTWAEKANSECAKAKELDAELPEVHTTLGQLLTQTGRPLEAIRQFETVLKQQPNSMESLLGLAAAYQAAGRAAEAEACYARAIALQPNYWAAYNQLGTLHYSQGNYRAAVEMFRRVVALTPDNLRGYNNLGAAYQQSDRFEDARQTYLASIKLRPSDGAYSNLGTLEYFLGHYRQAAEAFEHATQLSPEKALYWSNLGDAYRWAPGLRPKASTVYARAVRLAREELSTNPRSASARATIGLCLAKTGKPADGWRQIQEALEIEPSDPDLLYQAAVVSNLLGKPEEALEYLKRARARGFSAFQMAHEPEFENLRTTQSWAEVLKRITS